jgi:ribosomal protein S18 acetylase RimI-like enzyme
VWVEEGKILGICSYEIHDDKIEIHIIAVDENTRGRGIGGAMITAPCCPSRERGDTR